ncbi:MAG: hypothetical protein KAH32_06655 [Chlamydiia bacterium]|nr:hypothetical protein [Chlamydiia bacterium]
MKYIQRFATSLVALALIFAFSSCEKEQVNTNKEVSVYFDIASLGNKAAIDIKKDGTVGENPGIYPECTTDEVAYVIATIDDVPYTINMTLLPNSQTEVIQLDADADNELTSFIVYNDAGVPIYQMPDEDSDEADPLKGNLTSVPMDLALGAFTKSKIEVDVVCWHPYSHMNLTWAWFEINYHQLNTLCFFGDICTKYADDFHTTQGSPYINQEYDGYDFPAIFWAVITRAEYTDNSGVLHPEETWSANNVDNYATPTNVNDALCLTYRDNLQEDENFSYELFLFLPDGDTTLIHSGTFDDGAFSEMNNPNGFGGVDGLLTFAVGNCNNGSGVDEVLPPYLYLPEVGDIQVIYTNLADYEYFDVKLLGTSWDNALYPPELGENEQMSAWCVDLYHKIYEDEFTADVYNSLDIESLPTTEFKAYNWGALNWLANNEDIIHNILDSGNWENDRYGLQHTIWMVIHGTSAAVIADIEAETGHTVDQNMLDLVAEAISHPLFVPSPGQYSLLLLDPGVDDNGTTIQSVIIRVDP